MMYLYRVEGNNRKKQDKHGNGGGMLSYILAVDENDAKNGIANRIGKQNCHFKLVESIPIHGLSTHMIEDIITANYEIYKNIKNVKETEYQQDKAEYESMLEQSKKEGYEIDQIINDGRELQKEKSPGSKKKYKV